MRQLLYVSNTAQPVSVGDLDDILTAPQPRRAFQGWRYYTANDAPPDLPTAEGEAIPSDLAAQLRSIGAW